MSRHPRRDPRRREGDAHEVRAAQGPAPRRRPAADRARAPRGRRPSLPRPPSSIVGHQAEQVKDALRKRPGLALCSAGAAARHRPRLAAGGTASDGRERARWCCCRATCRCCAPATLARARPDTHEARGAAATVLTAVVPIAGRLRADRARRTGRIAAIVEHKDASPAEREIDEINSGIYAFDTGAAVRRAARRSARPTRRASTTCRTWCGSTATAGSRSRRSRSRTRARSSA